MSSHPANATVQRPGDMNTGDSQPVPAKRHTSTTSNGIASQIDAMSITPREQETPKAAAPLGDEPFNEVTERPPAPPPFEVHVPEGYYHVYLNNSDWVIPDRYQDLQPIGIGAYGAVCAANDNLTGLKVAVKKLAKPFQSLIHAKRTFRELRLLKHMQHENVIGLLDCFTPDGSVDKFQNLYLVTHLMGADLHNIVRVQQLTDDHVQFILYQLLRGLKYIHSAGIIHRDLKLANIAVNEDVELRILDFGLARTQTEEMTGYVATRWYRAPEIMLSWMRYDQTVDMWSVGCILGEMLTGKPLFPGKDYMDQLKLIMKLCGKPTREDIDKLDSEHAKTFIESLEDKPRADFKKIFKNSNPLVVDLMEKLLVLNPEKRPNAETCLRHPYLSTYHDSEDEPECDEIYDETIEREERDVEGWRRLTWDEYKSFEPPIFDSDSEDETETDSDETDSSDDDSQGTQDYDSNDAEEY